MKEKKGDKEEGKKNSVEVDVGEEKEIIEAGAVMAKK